MLWLKYLFDWKNLSTLVNLFLHWGFAILFSIFLICLFLFLVCPIFIIILIGAHCFFESLYLSILSGNKKLTEEKKKKRKYMRVSERRMTERRKSKLISSLKVQSECWKSDLITSSKVGQSIKNYFIKNMIESLKLPMAFFPYEIRLKKRHR